MFSSSKSRPSRVLPVCYEIWRGGAPDPGAGLWGAPFARCERGVCVEAATLEEAAAAIRAHYANPERESREGWRPLGPGDVIVANGEAFRVQGEGESAWPTFADFLLRYNI